MAIAYSSTPRFYGGGIVSPSGYGTAQADEQLSGWQNNLWGATMGKFPGLYAGFAPSAGFAGAWGLPGFAQGGAGATATASGGGAGGLPLLQTSKSPAGNAALSGLLGQASTLSTSPQQNVFTTVKDPAQAADTAATRGTVSGVNAAANQTLADYTRNFLAGDAQAKGFMTQETGAIGNVYGPASDPNSMTATLQRLVQQRNQAVQGSLQRALGQARRRANVGSLGFGGADSYTNQQFMDTAAGVMSNEAQQEAELNRQNYLSTLQAQTGLAGQRSGLLNSYLSRNLAPIQAGQQLNSSQLANLGALGNITNANQIYQTPEQLLGARLGLLGNYAGDLNALNIFGLGGNFATPNLGLGGRGGAPTSPSYPNPSYPGGNQDGLGAAGGGASPANALPAAYQNADPVTKAAALAYYQQSGQWPNQDASYSNELWQWARQQAMQGGLLPNYTPNTGSGTGGISGFDLGPSNVGFDVTGDYGGLT